MNSTADVLLTGEAANDGLGTAVSTARDMNGDGYDDVLVSATGNDAGGTNAGRAYVFFGGSLMNNTADVVMTGSAAGDLFGVSVSTVM